MSKVVKMPDNTKCYDEASGWVVKFDRGLSSDEETQFKKWVELDVNNYNTFMSMAKLWDGMDELSRLSDLFPEPAIEENKKLTTNRFSIAASFLVAAVMGILVSTGMMFSNGEKIYETSIGEHSTVSLSDGSKLVLNTNSLVRVEFDDRHRLLTLERGEIHINVAHDKSRPLSVKVADKVVQAVGTAFNIELLQNKKLELIVVDGKVRVGDRTRFEGKMREYSQVKDKSLPAVMPVYLNPKSLAVSKGEKILLGLPKQATVKIDDKAIEEDLSWRNGSLIFKGETLEEAIVEISRYTSVTFNIVDADLKSVRLAGLFKTGDVNGLLDSLDESFNISSQRISKEQVNLYKGEN